MHPDKETWRLLLHPPYSGAWNMAVDEALLGSVSNHFQPPTLRLYDWYPYTLSLGHAQPFSDVNMQILQEKKWDIVRRPTGGRAILHADELTYSVTAPIDNPIIHGNVIESYRKISTALASALNMIGLIVDSKLKNKNESHLSKDPVCFQFPSDYEITFNGKKIIGSAQARKKNGILQHGSIPLFGDISRIIDVLQIKEKEKMLNARSNLLDRAVTVEISCGKFISWSIMADALIKAFEDKLSINFTQGKMTRDELELAMGFYINKYKHPEWTFRL